MREGDDIKVLAGFLPDGQCVSVSLEPYPPERLENLEKRGATVREATIAECRKVASPGFKRCLTMLKRAAIARRYDDEMDRLFPLGEPIEGPF
ncbi:MAG: hypothetical protein H6Q99_291 [Proteobacteria bacterium]|nr:hypothetical protein [Pseudomonadota bacterium]